MFKLPHNCTNKTRNSLEHLESVKHACMGRGYREARNQYPITTILKPVALLEAFSRLAFNLSPQLPYHTQKEKSIPKSTQLEPNLNPALPDSQPTSFLLFHNPFTIQETWVRSLGWEDPLEKGMATHSCILAWKIPRTEEAGGLQSMGSQRVRQDWVTNTHTHTYT